MIRYADNAQPNLMYVTDDYGTVSCLRWTGHSIDGMAHHFYNGLDLWEVLMRHIDSAVTLEEH